MTASAQRPGEDPLFLACTRPAMAFGAPIEAVGINLILTGALFIGARGFASLLAAPLLHGLCRAACARDVNALRVLRLALETRGGPGAAGFGGRAFAPAPARRVVVCGGRADA